MKNRKLLLIVSIVLALTMSLGGTLAYLTDTDADVNTMVLGNVKITQNEQEWNADKTELVPFTQDKPLLPYVGEMGWENTTADGGDDAYRRFTMNNVVDKYVTVTNTGNTNAYVRTIIALEMGDYTYEEFKLIGISINDENGSEFEFTGAWNWVDDYAVEIDGLWYNIMVAEHQNPVKPGETTIPSLLQVYLSKDADNEAVQTLDGNKNGKYDIYVLSQAVQADGFEDASTALNAGFGAATKDKAAEVAAWMADAKNDIGTPGGDYPNNNPPTSDWTVVSTADELVAALENGEDVLFKNDIKIDPASMSNAYGTTGINVKNGQAIDGNGFTLDITGAGGTWDSGINTTGGLIKNLKVTGSFRGIFINHNSAYSETVVLENVIIDGPTYTISCDQGKDQNLIATNCTFNGWTSYAATLGNAKFVDCNFGEGAGYAFCRPYAPTEFVNCHFEAGYQIDARPAITLDNCLLDDVAVTEANLATLVTYNTANATVK